jgi:hypothetical protein
MLINRTEEASSITVHDASVSPVPATIRHIRESAPATA